MTWLDVMPAIPLTDYLGPIRTPQDPRWAAVAIGHDLAPTVCHVVACAGGGARPWLDINGWLADEILRPDLDDPQGFAYALRYYMRACHEQGLPAVLVLDGAAAATGAPLDPPSFGLGVIDRHTLGATTDADRLALAKALAEVIL